MPNRNVRNRPSTAPAELMAAYVNERNEELLDAIVTTAALVARADGRIEPAECGILIDFMDCSGFLSLFTPVEIRRAFERRVRQLDEEHGAELAVESLARLAGSWSARLVIDAGERVASVDGQRDARELSMLQLIRLALGRGAPSSPSLYP